MEQDECMFIYFYFYFIFLFYHGEYPCGLLHTTQFIHMGF
jgi:hypothetical protein